MAAASAGPRVNRRIPSRSGFGGVTAVTVPSAATWQVVPAGQGPSRTAAMPVRRPASRIAGQPAGRALPAGGDQRDARPARAAAPGRRRPGRRPRSPQPGQGQHGGFQLVEGGLERGGDGQAGDRGAAGAGQQPGGVGGRDDHGGQPGLGGRGLGEQGGEDRAGGRLGAGAGQAEAAEGGDVDGGLAVVAADAERDRAGRQLGPGGALRLRLRRAAGVPRRAQRRRRPRPAPPGSYRSRYGSAASGSPASGSRYPARPLAQAGRRGAGR